MSAIPSSSTIPIVIDELRASGRLRPGTRSLLAGFGVGFSWAGCLWTETWENQAAKGRSGRRLIAHPRGVRSKHDLGRALGPLAVAAWRAGRAGLGQKIVQQTVVVAAQLRHPRRIRQPVPPVRRRYNCMPMATSRLASSGLASTALASVLDVADLGDPIGDRRADRAERETRSSRSESASRGGKP